MTRDGSSEAALLLAQELYLAGLAPQQNGFLYVRQSSGQRCYDTWSGVLHATGDHSATIVVVTGESDEPLWRRILGFLGTGPSVAVILTYRNLTYVDVRNCGSPEPRLSPKFRRVLSPDIIVWDQAHRLHTVEAKRRFVAERVAHRAGLNLWVSDNPAARPEDLGIYRELLESRGVHDLPNGQREAAGAERWLQWRGTDQSRVVSRTLRELVFSRDQSGVLGGTIHPRYSGTRIEFRPVTGSSSQPCTEELHWGRTTTPQTRAVFAASKSEALADMAQSLVYEGQQCCVVGESDIHLQKLYDTISQNAQAATALVASGQQAADAAVAATQNRCCLLHAAHSPALPAPGPGRYRSIVLSNVPTTFEELSSLLQMVAPRCTLVFPYVLGSPEEKLVEHLSPSLIRRAVGYDLDGIEIERY